MNPRSPWGEVSTDRQTGAAHFLPAKPLAQQVPGLLRWLVGLCLALTAPCGWAGLGGFCSPGAEPGAAVQDRLIQVAAVVKAELEASGHRAAIVARSGMALQRIGQRYSHAGVSLQDNPNTPWSVRQLYFACDEKRPRIFDQGLSGFVLGVHDADVGFVSVLLLPPSAEATLAQATLNDTLALQLLGGTYSANAHAFSLKYQNCNQWLAELLATAWGGLPGGVDARAQAQAWLQQQGYQATLLSLGWSPLLWLAPLSPWLHTDDHPATDLSAAQLRVSMPEGLERFVRGLVPGTQRLEFCYTARHVVLRQGWEPLPDSCVPAATDRVVLLSGAPRPVVTGAPVSGM